MDIDFVITWVDCNDKNWQTVKSQYQACSKNFDVSEVRYQNWDNLKYWFRAVESYAPWVRKIHFVTCGQIPPWLNIRHSKINLVNHCDYMPKEALPTFNSGAIEVGLNKIEGLAESFVYFNDDMFLTDYIEPNYCFYKGVPKETPGLAPRSRSNTVFADIIKNNIKIINRNFDYKNVCKKIFLDGLILFWVSAH